MTDTKEKSTLWLIREARGYGREQVARRPELDPPITTRTLARWEEDPTPLLKKRWRLVQLAAIYETTPGDLLSTSTSERAA
jgi:transcriptional regulator with XRE-family HTH domain